MRNKELDFENLAYLNLIRLFSFSYVDIDEMSTIDIVVAVIGISSAGQGILREEEWVDQVQPIAHKMSISSGTASRAPIVCR